MEVSLIIQKIAGRRGQYIKPNGFGLHDMIGNAAEWCEDWFGYRTYSDLKGKPQTDPVGTAKGDFRVARGGSWFHGPKLCRVSSRNGAGPEDLLNFIGFRVARDAVPAKAEPDPKNWTTE